MDSEKLVDFHRFETITEYANFFDQIIDKLNGLDCEFDEKECKNYLIIVNLVEYHGERLREQDTIDNDFIQFSLSSKEHQLFFRDVIVGQDFCLLNWVSQKILKHSNGHHFLPLIRQQYRQTSSKEEFLKLQLEHFEFALIESVENEIIGILLRDQESLVLASILEDPDIDEMIRRITILLKSLDQIEELEFILQIISFSFKNRTRKIFTLTLLVFCELLVTFDSPDSISLWKTFLNFLEDEINNDLIFRILKIDYFYETINTFIKTYLQLLEQDQVKEDEVFFLIPESKLLENKCQLLGRFQINHIILLVKFLLHENSPVRRKFSDNLFKNFHLPESLVDYCKNLLRNL